MSGGALAGALLSVLALAAPAAAVVSPLPGLDLPPPTNVQAQQMHDYMLVTWDPPEVDSTVVVLSYLVFARISSDAEWQLSGHTRAQQLRAHGIAPVQPWEFSVQALTNLGPSQPSAPVGYSAPTPFITIWIPQEGALEGCAATVEGQCLPLGLPGTFTDMLACAGDFLVGLEASCEVPPTLVHDDARVVALVVADEPVDRVDFKVDGAVRHVERVGEPAFDGRSAFYEWRWATYECWVPQLKRLDVTVEVHTASGARDADTDAMFAVNALQSTWQLLGVGACP